LAIDAAMTHRLFFQPVQAVTARLEIRYRRPVRPGTEVEIRARVVSRRPTAYRFAAEARQGRFLCAEATATFLDLGGSKSIR
jgi:acyl-CoA thioesterase FadM